jgi:hypothetical protein
MFLNIKLTNESIDILINAMREVPMPHKISHDLIVDLHTQRDNELKAQADAAQAAAKAEAAAAKAKAEKRAAKAKPAAPAAPVEPQPTEADILS